MANVFHDRPSLIGKNSPHLYNTRIYIRIHATHLGYLLLKSIFGRNPKIQFQLITFKEIFFLHTRQMYIYYIGKQEGRERAGEKEWEKMKQKRGLGLRIQDR